MQSTKKIIQKHALTHEAYLQLCGEAIEELRQEASFQNQEDYLTDLFLVGLEVRNSQDEVLHDNCRFQYTVLRNFYKRLRDIEPFFHTKTQTT
jgi:hypothetical protein